MQGCDGGATPKPPYRGESGCPGLPEALRAVEKPGWGRATSHKRCGRNPTVALGGPHPLCARTALDTGEIVERMATFVARPLVVMS